MLIEFKFKNFKSFKNETSLDFSATKISEFNIHVRNVSNQKVLPLSVIYGGNASGKTNVIDAFSYMTNYVLNSFSYSDEEKNDKLDFFSNIPFLFDLDSKKNPSEFEIYFTVQNPDDEKIYNYGFSIREGKVEEEWLNYKAKTSRGNYRTIFYRNILENKLDLSGLPKKSHDNIKISLGKEVLIVSLGAKLRIEKLKIVRDWFSKNKFADFGGPLNNYFISKTLPVNFIEKEVQNSVVKYLSTFDPSIIGFNVEVSFSNNINDNKRKIYNIESIHKVNGTNKTVSIPIEKESAGTLKMFSLYQYFQDVFKNGSVLLIDELNARLHPLLVRSIILSFANPEINNKNAQLLFTSHDSWLLESDTLRRDEFWFTEKNFDGISSLYSLVDFKSEDGNKIRKDENYEKNYLIGKYGAIPKLSQLIF
ncbi:MAG: AAA family ATPase [Pleomorphochaeta sp.]